MLKIGIVGLPNVGKSTLFQALTKKQVDIASYPFTTIEPNVGVVSVLDERLEKLADLVRPKKTVPAVIEFVDIAGLVKDAYQGAGLGNQFLSHIYSVDAVLFLLRCFKDGDILVLAAEPKEQFEILKNELAQKDASKKDVQAPLLASKPTLIVGNIKTGGDNHDCNFCDLKIDAQLEMELAELSPQELAELQLSSHLPQLITLAYQTLELITFYTIKGGQELRAWSIKIGTLASQAGGQVHSDFEEKFIRAEVIPWDQLVEAGSWLKARELGQLRVEGKEYIVRDGDVIEFKI